MASQLALRPAVCATTLRSATGVEPVQQFLIQMMDFPIKYDGFFTKNDGTSIKNHGFCTKTDGFCIYNSILHGTNLAVRLKTSRGRGGAFHIEMKILQLKIKILPLKKYDFGATRGDNRRALRESDGLNERRDSTQYALRHDPSKTMNFALKLMDFCVKTDVFCMKRHGATNQCHRDAYGA